MSLTGCKDFQKTAAHFHRAHNITIFIHHNVSSNADEIHCIQASNLYGRPLSYKKILFRSLSLIPFLFSLIISRQQEKSNGFPTLLRLNSFVLNQQSNQQDYSKLPYFYC